MSDPYTVDVKIIQSFSPSDYSSFQKTFKSYDKNKNGTIERNELVGLLHSLGYRDLKSEDVDEALKNMDLNDDKVISFSEFLQAMKKMIQQGTGDTETSVITGKNGKKIVKIENRRESSGHAYSSFSEEERAAYVKVINDALGDDEVCKKYLPIDPRK